MKVAALVPYHTDFCAGQRFRIELWARHLRSRGIEVDYFPFASTDLTSALYQKGRTLGKAQRMLLCFVDQLSRVMVASKPDVVFIYREASLIGPSLIESLTKRWKAPIIYDIDEPLFVPYVSPSNGWLSALKFGSKTHSLFRMSAQVFAVNKAIADYASRFTRNVSIVPMAVDTERYRPGLKPAGLKPRIGWVGTITNQPNLELVAKPLARIAETRGAILRVIADEPVSLPGVEVEFVKWNYEQEVSLLQDCQIGIVPVRASAWSPWKFFFKLIQYMSLGLAVVATPTGSNLEIVRDGVNGLYADSEDEWYEKVVQLIDNPTLRDSMGKAARETAVNNFSLSRQIDFIENAFRTSIKVNKAQPRH